MRRRVVDGGVSLPKCRRRMAAAKLALLEARFGTPRGGLPVSEKFLQMMRRGIRLVETFHWTLHFALSEGFPDKKAEVPRRRRPRRKNDLSDATGSAGPSINPP